MRRRLSENPFNLTTFETKRTSSKVSAGTRTAMLTLYSPLVDDRMTMPLAAVTMSVTVSRAAVRSSTVTSTLPFLIIRRASSSAPPTSGGTPAFDV